MRAAVEAGRAGAARRPHPEARPCRAVEPAIRPRRNVRLPDPPLLLVTDRRQARRPLADVVAAALARRLPLGQPAREGSARRRADRARAHAAARWRGATARGSRCTAMPRWRKPPASTACICRPAAMPAAARKLLGTRQAHRRVDPHRRPRPRRSIRRSADYAIAGPAFETASKPGYGPEIGRKGLAEIVARGARSRCSRSAASTPRARPRCWRPAPPASRSWAASCARPIPAGR